MSLKKICVTVLPIGFLLLLFLPYLAQNRPNTAEPSSENTFPAGEILSASLPEKVPSPVKAIPNPPVAQTAIPKERSLEEIPFDGKLAHQYLTELCAIGPRPSGSEGMIRQQNYLIEHFTKHGAQVQKQGFQFPYPGKPFQKVPGMNLIFRWKPERMDRILLCAHYDTLPIPTKNPPQLQNLPFVGAEDNAGGIGILMVLAQSLPEILEKEQTRYGIDIVMLDAEEFMFRPGDRLLPNERFCWGSEFFGRVYASQTPQERGGTYLAGVLLDMVTQENVVLLKEGFSYQNPKSRPIQSEIWNLARDLGVREFKSRIGSFITDDHIYLQQFGQIPVIDIIDLDFAQWHTHEDTPDKCSPLSAARVGWVIQEWIRQKK